MSGSTAKSERRQMRRVLGEVGARRLSAVSEQANQSVQRAYEAANAVTAALNRIGAVEDRVAKLEGHGETLWARLRWLFTGK